MKFLDALNDLIKITSSDTPDAMLKLKAQSDIDETLTPEQVLEGHGMKTSEWEVTSFRIESEWKNIRDDDGEVETKFVHEYFLVVKPAEAPAEVQAGWVPIRPATAINVKLDRAKPVDRVATRAMILPDPQIGFIFTPDGKSWTTHSTEAMSIALTAIERLQPDVIVNLGDFFDFAEWSTKYATPKALNETTQASLEAGYRFLKLQRELCDEVHVIEGNHDKRIADLLLKGAKAAVGLRQAGDVAGWPLMSLQHMLNVDELGIHWAAGYPGARVNLRDDIVCMHGEKLHMRDQAHKTPYLFNTIQGHIHKFQVESRTFENADGSSSSYKHMSPGCLCRITGEVPGFNSSQDHIGRPNPIVNNWQQGFMVLDYTDQIGSSFGVTQYEVIDESSFVNGELLTPDADVMDLFHQGSVEAARTFTR